MKISPFKLERYFARHEFSAPYLLCSSDCETLTVGDLLSLESSSRAPGNHDARPLTAFLDLRLGYTESLGHPDLRREIATLYEKVSPDDVLVHAGAEEGIFNFMNTLLEPGDRVVVHSPCYQSLGEVAAAVGAEVIPWHADPEKGWALDLDWLGDLLGGNPAGGLESGAGGFERVSGGRLPAGRVKAVVVNFPHNPTGYLPDAGFLKDLSDLSDRHGFIVFCDEVYRGLEHDPDHRLPAFADLNDRAISLGVMSKTYGLAGLRIGWIATRNRGVFDSMAAFKDYTTICSSGPSEFLAALALRHRDKIVERNLGIIRRNLDLLDGFFGRHSDLFDWQRPVAGPIAFPRLKDRAAPLKGPSPVVGVSGSGEACAGGTAACFCESLVGEAGVLLAPGNLFCDCPGSDRFRIGFGRENLPECLEKFEEFCAKNGMNA